MYGNETLPTIDVNYKLCPFYGLFKSKDVKLELLLHCWFPSQLHGFEMYV
jgi:hypothetical protein